MQISKTILLLSIGLAFVLGLYVQSCNHPSPVDQPVDNPYLQQQLDMITSQGKRLEKNDSILMAAHQQRVAADRAILDQLKKRRDEKNAHMDTAGNDELRRILAED
jgi:hypothetical protein